MSISDFLEKHQVDIDAFNFATMHLMLPITGPTELAYKSVQLSIKGVKPIVALESLAKLSGKTLTEVMEAIKAGMPLLGKMAEAIARLKQLGATDELISLIQKSESIAGLDRLENLLQRYFSCDDIATLRKYGISTAEYEAKGITYSSAAENVSRMLNTSDSYVDLYRAVGVDEFMDIKNTGIFRVKQDGSAYAGKQFGFNFNEILNLSDSLADAVAIYKVRIPKDVFVKLDFTPVDTSILKSGSLTVKNDFIELFNSSLKELVQVF